MEEKLYITLKENMENHISKKIEEYNKSMTQVFESKTFPERYRGLALFYHNTMEQGELGILMLKSFLTNDFFIKNEPKNDCNVIVYEDDEFKVYFSKSLVMRIEIINKTSTTYGFKPSPVSEDLLTHKRELENWLHKKDFNTFKKLVKRKEKNWAKNIIARIVLYYTICFKISEKDLQEVDRIIKNIESSIKTYEEKKLKHEENQEKARKFVDSLTDLKVFQNEGWKIFCKDIYEKDTKNRYQYK